MRIPDPLSDVASHRPASVALFSSRPQVTWQKSISTYQDAGIAKGFWKKALELLTGSEENRISKPYGILADDHGRLFIADRAPDAFISWI